jgi:hypothetical protein
MPTLSQQALTARWSGRNFAKAERWGYAESDAEDERDNPPDEYRLQLWPDADECPPTDIKRWPTIEP